MNYDLVVIGGGAAGFFGALACAEARPTARVLILEKANALLGKVRISGGGRCNLTNACFEPARLVQFYPRGGMALRGAFSRFQPRDTMAWFEQHGVPLKREADGRVFPLSDLSESIVACLLSEARRLGIEIRTRWPVEEVCQGMDGLFEVRARGGERLQARAVLVATGGETGGFRLASGQGHKIAAPAPSLFTFKVQDPCLEGLAGVAVADGSARFPDLRLEQRGAILVTHWGLSGPAILRLSAFAARELMERSYQARLEINWLGDVTLDALMQQLSAFKSANGRKQVSGHGPCANVPLRLWKHLAVRAGIPEAQVWASLSRAQLQALCMELVQGSFAVCGKGEFKEEFVTCGGVELDEVDFRRMESKLIPGLFFAGEVLNIDGLTGGFNLQAAWTTGWIAGQAAAARIPTAPDVQS